MCKDIVENMVPRICSAYKMVFYSSARMTRRCGKMREWKHLQAAMKQGVGMVQWRILSPIHQPDSVEFDHVVNVADYRFGSIREITTLKHTASFHSLSMISIELTKKRHSKKRFALYQIVFRSWPDINDDHSNLPKKLKGPNGSI